MKDERKQEQILGRLADRDFHKRMIIARRPKGWDSFAQKALEQEVKRATAGIGSMDREIKCTTTT